MDRWELYHRIGGMTLTEILTTRDPEVLAAMADVVTEISNSEPEICVTVWVDDIAYPQY